MQDLTEFNQSLKELQKVCPVAVIHIPQQGKDMPFSSYSLAELLEFISFNLEEKSFKCFVKP